VRHLPTIHTYFHHLTPTPLPCSAVFTGFTQETLFLPRFPFAHRVRGAMSEPVSTCFILPLIHAQFYFPQHPFAKLPPLPLFIACFPLLPSTPNCLFCYAPPTPTQYPPDIARFPLCFNTPVASSVYSVSNFSPLLGRYRRPYTWLHAAPTFPL